MIYLALAMISSMLVAVLMRVSEKGRKSQMGILAVNYLMCVVLSVAFSGGMELFPAVEGRGLTIGLGFINGILFLAGFMLLQWNISVNGVVLPATFMRLGVIVPTVLAITVFGEKPEFMQIAGVIIAIAAIFVMQGKGGGAQNFAGLIILLFTGGSCDAMSKVYEHFGSQALKDHFLLYTFTVALILCVAICLFKREMPSWRDMLYGLMIGVPNYLSTRFLLLSLNDVSAVVAYPSYSVGTIVLVTLVGVAFFKERLGKRKLTALVMILAALALLNI